MGCVVGVCVCDVFVVRFFRAVWCICVISVILFMVMVGVLICRGYIVRLLSRLRAS